MTYRRNSMNIRDKFAQLNDDSNRKLWRNKSNNLVRNSKSTFYRQLIESNIGNSKKMWNPIRDLTLTLTLTLTQQL